jgi:hypothetical protein
MISVIKSYLSTLLISVTELKKDKVFLSAKDEVGYNLAPWISILSDTAKVEKDIRKENYSKSTNSIIETQQKYKIKQPLKIAISGKDESTVDKWVISFFEKLDSGFKSDNTWINIEPVSITYTDSASKIRGQFIAIIIIDFYYGIYTTKEIPKIKDIHLGGINYE